jgi:hypothetical protein
MAYAAYRESFGANRFDAPPQGRRCENSMVLDVTVPSQDAFRVRQLLARCPAAGVLRCVPRLHESLVRLEIKLPADKVSELLHLLMASIPCGEVGALTSWKRHLTEHGLTHGF